MTLKKKIINFRKPDEGKRKISYKRKLDVEVYFEIMLLFIYFLILLFNSKSTKRIKVNIT